LSHCVCSWSSPGSLFHPRHILMPPRRCVCMCVCVPHFRSTIPLFILAETFYIRSFDMVQWQHILAANALILASPEGGSTPRGLHLMSFFKPVVSSPSPSSRTASGGASVAAVSAAVVGAPAGSTSATAATTKINVIVKTLLGKLAMPMFPHFIAGEELMQETMQYQ
jgi:hypothetical protein